MAAKGGDSAGGARLGRMALRVFAYSLLLGFVCIMFAPVMISDNWALRVLFNTLILLAAGFLYYADGASRGEKDCAMGDLLARRAAERGAPSSPTDMPYRPLKALAAAGLAALPWVILGTLVSIWAVPYTYTLQDLPSWLGAYRRLPEVGRALTYYDVPHVTPWVDWVRVAFRFSALPFVYLFGADGDAASLAFDRFCPLAALALPACFAMGYLDGPRRNKKTRKFIEEVKARPRKRLKKKSGGRGPRKQEPNRLI
jgi:hypothetical protein